jgi:hypothetical protein
LGGRIFPGICHHAAFQVAENGDHYRIELNSDDGQTHMLVAGKIAGELPQTSVFASVSEASSFFEKGSLGYSVTPQPGQFEGLQLHTFNWQVQPLAVEKVESRYFEDESKFPRGSIAFDSSFLMRGIKHEWHGREMLCAGPGC